MFRRTDETGSGSGGAAAEAETGAPGLPNLTGDLDSLLSTAPCFRTRVVGYERLQVDNYVAWAESELATGRRQIEQLLARYGVCSAELEISRRLLAQAPRGIDVSPVSDRVRAMLSLAAEEATAMVDAASEEADRLVAEARVEADARLDKAQQIKELAADAADGMLDQATRDRAEAAALLDQARIEAAEMVATAAGERNRLIGEAAEARERLVALQTEVAELHRQREEAQSSLRRLTDVIGKAMSLATGAAPYQYLLLDNHVADIRVESVSS